MTNKKHIYGRVALVDGTIGDFAAATLNCMAVRQGSTYLSETFATLAGFTSLLGETASIDTPVPSVAINTDLTRDKVFITADPVVWTTFTPGHIIVGLLIYLGTNPTAIPIWSIGLPQPVTVPSNGHFTFSFNSDGIIEI